MDFFFYQYMRWKEIYCHWFVFFLINITILHNPHFIAMGFPFLVCRSVQPWFMLISPDTRLSTGSIQLMKMKKIILILIWCRFHWWLPNTKEIYFPPLFSGISTVRVQSFVKTIFFWKLRHFLTCCKSRLDLHLNFWLFLFWHSPP